MDDRTSEQILREKARQALAAGRVPRKRPDRTLGGLGRGRICAVCDELITLTQMEREVEYRQKGSESDLIWYHFHPRCFAAWEIESSRSDARTNKFH